MLSSTGLAEESIESIVTSTNCFVAWHLAIRLDTVLKAEELPASISNLNAALAEVEAQHFTHFESWAKEKA